MSDSAAVARYLAWLTEAAADPSAPPAVVQGVREALTQPELQDSSQSLGQRALADASPLAELLSSASYTQEWEGVRLLHELPRAPELIPVLHRQTWSSARDVSEAWELALLERVPAFLERHAFDGAVDAVAEMLCADPGEASGRDTWVRSCDRVRWLVSEHAERLDARRSEVFGAGVDAWLSELEPTFGEQIAERTRETPDRLARARSLLDGGLDPDAVLHATAARGSTPLFRLLLDAGADPGARDAKGRSSLDLALGAGGVKGRVGHAAIAGVLLDRGQVPADGLKPGKWAKARLASAAPSYGDDQTGLGWMLTREPAPEHRAELLTRCLKQVLDRKSLSQELLEAWASLYPESLAQALLHHLEQEPAAFRAIAYADAALFGDRWRRRLGDGHLAPRLGDALSAHFERLLELAGPSPDDNAQMLLHVAARPPEQERRAWERSEAAAVDQQLLQLVHVLSPGSHVGLRGVETDLSAA